MMESWMPTFLMRKSVKMNISSKESPIPSIAIENSIISSLPASLETTKADMPLLICN